MNAELSRMSPLQGGRPMNTREMKLDCSVTGEVKIRMTDCVKSMIEAFPVALTGTVRHTATPAKDRLFNSSQGKTMSPLEVEAFHIFVATVRLCSSQ